MSTTADFEDDVDEALLGTEEEEEEYEESDEADRDGMEEDD